MNIDLKEIRKMVTTALIQERVGYYGHQVEGDAGEPSEDPNFDELIADAEQGLKQGEAARENQAKGVTFKSFRELVAPLALAGIPPSQIKDMLGKWYSEVMSSIQLVKNVKEEQADASAAAASAAVTKPPPAPVGTVLTPTPPAVTTGE